MGAQCYNVAVSTVDGSSACGPTTCTAGQYCFDSVGICNQGCTTVTNCARGQYCDLSNAMPDMKGTNFGTCRSPGPAQVIPCSSGTEAGGGACPDVHGVYDVTLDTASSSAGCGNSFMTTQCTITQSSCALEWSCSPNNGFATSTVDGNGQSPINIVAPNGTATCAIAFQTGSFTWDCQLMGSGGNADCKGTGAKQ